MKAKFKLKLKISQLGRAVESCKYYEEQFNKAVKLLNLGKKTSMYKKLRTRVDDSRNRWWKELDDKIKLEIEIKTLNKVLIEDLLKGV